MDMQNLSPEADRRICTDGAIVAGDSETTHSKLGIGRKTSSRRARLAVRPVSEWPSREVGLFSLRKRRTRGREKISYAGYRSRPRSSIRRSGSICGSRWAFNVY